MNTRESSIPASSAGPTLRRTTLLMTAITFSGTMGKFVTAIRATVIFTGPRRSHSALTISVPVLGNGWAVIMNGGTEYSIILVFLTAVPALVPLTTMALIQPRRTSQTWKPAKEPV